MNLYVNCTLYTCQNCEGMQTPLVIVMKYSRLHSGGGTAGNAAEFASIFVHIVVRFPINSKPALQL